MKVPVKSPNYNGNSVKKMDRQVAALLLARLYNLPVLNKDESVLHRRKTLLKS